MTTPGSEIRKGEGKTLTFYFSVFELFMNVYYLGKRQKILKKTLTLIPPNSFFTFPSTLMHHRPQPSTWHIVGMCDPDTTTLPKSHFHVIHRVHLSPCMTDEKNAP